MNFQPVSIEKYCPSITYDFRIKKLRNTQLVDILIISFHGSYRYGSAGSPDAGLIKGIITTGLSIFKPFSLLIDLSDLEYNWGDNLDLSFSETGETNTVVLIGQKCRRGLSTLSFGIDSTQDIVDNNFFFDSFDKAIEKLENKTNH